MIKRKTVFVVGAGASAELNFPLGGKLLAEVGKSLSFVQAAEGGRARGWTPKNNDLWEQIQRYAAPKEGSTEKYIAACQRVNAAAILGRSIDNVIHQHNDDEAFVFCAKMGIAYEILKCEKSSSLFSSYVDDRDLNLSEIKEAWLVPFLQALCLDGEKKNVDQIFNNVSIICFNYDRSILRFLPIALTTQFLISIDEAHAICRNLSVFHPYGSLGLLPWQGDGSKVPYGGGHGVRLVDVAANLRTFTERRHNPDELGRMQRCLKEADRIVFLGFGYIEQNLELILGDRENFAARSVIGTGMKLTHSDHQVIPEQLKFLFSKSYFGGQIELPDMTCHDFLHDQFRSITSN